MLRKRREFLNGWLFFNATTLPFGCRCFRWILFVDGFGSCWDGFLSGWWPFIISSKSLLCLKNALQIYVRNLNEHKLLKKRKQNRSFGAAFIDMWFIMLSKPSGKLPVRRAERLFLATCFFSNVIFIGTFQVGGIFWITHFPHFIWPHLDQMAFLFCFRVHWSLHSQQ